MAAIEAELVARGRDVVATQEPGGTMLGDVVSQLVRRGRLARRVFQPSVDPQRWSGLDARTELLLFAAARVQHVRDVIRPAMERGAIVLCDRFVASTVAYQGDGRGLPFDEIAVVNRIATGGLAPHLTILLDIAPEVALGRVSSDPRVDRFRSEDLAFHERIRQGYLRMARAEPQRWLVLDANSPPGHLVRDAVARIEALTP